MINPQLLEELIDKLAERIAEKAIPPWLNPRRRDWRWHVEYKANEVLPPNTEKTLLDIDAAGWFYYAIFWVNDPDVHVKLDLRADGKVEIDVTPRMLYEDMGALSRAQGFGVINYDPANNNYVLEFGPGIAGTPIPFRGKARASVYNPKPTEARIVFYQVWLILLK